MKQFKKTMTLSEALADLTVFKRWNNGEIISDTLFKKLRAKAKKVFNSCSLYEFENEQAFTSSSDLHGFYFPNYRGRIRLIAFSNDENYTPIIILDDEE